MNVTLSPLWYVTDIDVTGPNHVWNWLSVLFAIVALYICNWVLYHILLEVLWSVQEPNPVLLSVAEWLDVFFDPLPARMKLESLPIFWPRPFSKWLRIYVTFVIWALPDRNLKLSPGALGLGVASTEEW